MTVMTPNGTEEVSVPRFMRTQTTLSEEQLVDMARLAIALEEQMGWPVDMESAYQGDELYLLQCRLITTLTEPGEACTGWPERVYDQLLCTKRVPRMVQPNT
jgi:pyruvate,water dikinase